MQMDEGQSLADLMIAVQLTVLTEQNAVINALGLPSELALGWIACHSGAASTLTKSVVVSGVMPDLDQVASSLTEAVLRAGSAGVAVPLLNITKAGFSAVVAQIRNELAGQVTGLSAASGRGEMAAERPTVAFYGLGRMGAPLALHLVQAGFPVTVYNRSLGPTEPFLTKGVRVAGSPAAAAKGAKFHITCLTDVAALQSVADGPDGFLTTATAGSIWIDMTTSSRADSQRFSSLAATRSVTMVDAAMAGGVLLAESGQLTFLVGGSKQAVTASRDLLTTMGSGFLHVGMQGDGHTLKLLNNGLFTSTTAGLAEVTTISHLYGVERGEWLERFMAGPTTSRNLGQKAEMMRKRHYPSGSALNFTVKDIGYTLAMAKERGVAIPVTATAWALYRYAQVAGFGPNDPASILGWMESLT